MAKMDPRVFKTLRNIDDALLANLREHPFRNITIEMLCNSAMINRSTFYKYYSDKYALLDNMLSRYLEEFRQEVKADFVLAQPETVDAPCYEELFRDISEYLYTNRERFQTLWKAAIERSIYDEMVFIARDEILCKMQEIYPPETTTIYQELYASFFASNMMGLIRWWFQHEREVTREQVLHIMSCSMKKGLFYSFWQDMNLN